MTLQTYLLVYVATCRVSDVARFVASQGAMRAFLMHSHGKLRFSNKHVDLDTLRPARPEGARLLVLPNIQIQGSTRLERVTSLRDQIHQVNVEMHLHVRRLQNSNVCKTAGLLMIHQMMLLCPGLHDDLSDDVILSRVA